MKTITKTPPSNAVSFGDSVNRTALRIIDSHFSDVIRILPHKTIIETVKKLHIRNVTAVSRQIHKIMATNRRNRLEAFAEFLQTSGSSYSAARLREVALDHGLELTDTETRKLFRQIRTLKDRQITIRISSKTHDELRRHCRIRNASIAEIAEEAFRLYFASLKNDPGETK